MRSSKTSTIYASVLSWTSSEHEVHEIVLVVKVQGLWLSIDADELMSALLFALLPVSAPSMLRSNPTLRQHVKAVLCSRGSHNRSASTSNSSSSSARKTLPASYAYCVTALTRVQR